MNTRSFHPLAYLTFAVAIVAALPSVVQAAPRDELLRLVPDDVAFCLVVQDLRAHSQALAGSPFAESLKKSPLGAALRDSGEIKKLLEFNNELRKQLGLDSVGIADKLLGDAFTFAYRPNPPGKENQDQELFLLRARDAQVLADFIERLNRSQKESGDLKEIQECRHAGAVYFRRSEKKGDNFYYVNGPVLAFSSQEDMLRQAIERDRKETSGESAVAKQFRLHGIDKALVGLWLNPRAFDSEMERNRTKAQGTEAAVQQAFLRWWKALDGIALAFSLEKDARLTLSLRGRTDALPAAAKRLFGEAARASDLWQRFPEDALFAMAGRMDLSALLEVMGDFQTKEARESMIRTLEGLIGAPAEKNFVRDVLPSLGPDIGLCVLTPAATDKSAVPQGFLALRIRGDNGAAAAILAAVAYHATAARIAYLSQGKTIDVKSVRQDRVEVKYLDGAGVFPAGIQPAYALKDGYLVLASSPEAVRRFGAAAGAKPSGEVPLMRLSAKALSTYLTERRDALIPIIAERNNLSKEDAGKRLDGLLAGLQLLDRIEITQASEAGKMSLTLRMQMAQSLK